MFFVPSSVNIDNGLYLVMGDHGTEGWSILSQHHDKTDAFLWLADNAYGKSMIVKLTDFNFEVTD